MSIMEIKLFTHNLKKNEMSSQKSTQTPETSGETLSFLYDNMRNLSYSVEKKRKMLAQHLTEQCISLEKAFQMVIESERTGWKEVICSMMQITGTSLEELPIPVGKQEKIQSFLHKTKEVVTSESKDAWALLVVKKSFIVSKAKELEESLEKANDFTNPHVNKNTKRFTRLLGEINKHIDQTHKVSLQSFTTNIIPNKVAYAGKHTREINSKTKEIIEKFFEEYNVEAKKFEPQSNEKKILDFIKYSFESILQGTFCKDQKTLISGLQNGFQGTPLNVPKKTKGHYFVKTAY